MKTLALLTAAALSLSAVGAFAQASGGNVRVAPGQICADNKCVRFSRDLQSVSIQSRVAASVASYSLRNDPVVSLAEFKEIFALALRQNNLGTSR
jgi:hypothetical protein